MDVGLLFLWIALIVAVCSAIFPVIGIKNKDSSWFDYAKYAIYANAVLLTFSIIALANAFVKGDYGLYYVYSYSSRSLPLLYKLSGVWAGQAGSILFWAWLLAIFSAFLVYQNRNRNQEIMPYVKSIVSVILVFFIALMIVAPPLSDYINTNFRGYSVEEAQRGEQAILTNPFETSQKILQTSPSDGSGLNPLLQNYGMLLHPPTLFIGYAGFAIPFALALAALITGKVEDSEWIRAARKWAIFSWLFLGIGIVIGAQWAYMELGWGGYWAWDPVENASLFPWLTATAFLHSVMIQEKKNMLRIWNMVLVVTTFVLCIFGTWITRSGLSQAHGFPPNLLGRYYLAFIFLVLAYSITMLVKRLKNLQSENTLGHFLSREVFFVLNNIIFSAMAFIVVWLTVSPLLTQIVTGQKKAIGPSVFNIPMVPLALLMFVVMAICPFIAWKRASKKNLEKNFVYPIIVALVVGLMLIVFGVVQAPLVQTAALVLLAIAAVFILRSNNKEETLQNKILTSSALGGSVGGIVVFLGYLLTGKFATFFRADHPWALAILVALSFVASTIIMEFYRGTRFRYQRYLEESTGQFAKVLGVFVALGQLIWKNKRRYGGYIVHTGVVLMFVGITASSTWKIEKSIELSKGQSEQVGNYTFKYEGFTNKKTSNVETNTGKLSLWKNDSNGIPEFVTLLKPAQAKYKVAQESNTTSEIDLIWWNLREDVFTVLNGYSDDGSSASFKILINPLLIWIWIGGIIMIFGAVICMWPGVSDNIKFVGNRMQLAYSTVNELEFDHQTGKLNDEDFAKFKAELQAPRPKQAKGAGLKAANFCTNCGKPLGKGIKFCTNCGNKV